MSGFGIKLKAFTQNEFLAMYVLVKAITGKSYREGEEESRYRNRGMKKERERERRGSRNVYSPFHLLSLAGASDQVVSGGKRSATKSPLTFVL